MTAITQQDKTETVIDMNSPDITMLQFTVGLRALLSDAVQRSPEHVDYVLNGQQYCAHTCFPFTVNSMLNKPSEYGMSYMALALSHPDEAIGFAVARTLLNYGGDRLLDNDFDETTPREILERMGYTGDMLKYTPVGLARHVAASHRKLKTPKVRGTPRKTKAVAKPKAPRKKL